MSRRPGAVARAAALALGAALATAGAMPAAATGDPSDGLWYYGAAELDSVHRTSRGEGITIAVLDSPINPAFPDLLGADLHVHEPSFCAAEEGGPALPATSTGAEANHGTGITALLVGTGAGLDGQTGIPGVAPDVTVNYYAVARPRDDGSGLVECPAPADRDASVGRPENAALLQAIADGADVISFSTSGHYLARNIAAAQRAGIILVASAGNRAGPVSGDPAAMNGVVAVGSLTPEVTLWESSPSGEQLGVVAPGVAMRVPDLAFDGYMTVDGSSLAAPFTAGSLALAWSLHPDATANQMIQALFRTTGGTTHRLERDDSWGYGIVNAGQLVRVSPAAFPDENPMLFDGTDRIPLVADVLTAEATPSPTPTVTADPPTGADPQDAKADERSGAPIGLITGIVGGVALALVLTVVLLGRHRHRATATDPREGHDGHPG